MFCPNCGTQYEEGALVCARCRKNLPRKKPLSKKKDDNNISQEKESKEKKKPDIKIGYSKVINDPKFISFRKKKNLLFNVISIIVIIMPLLASFFFGLLQIIKMSEAIRIGVLVSGILLFVRVLVWVIRLLAKPWEGVVIEKKVIEEHVTHYRNKRRRTGIIEETYNVYYIVVRKDSGATDMIIRKDSFYYNYFKIGDKLRYIPEINYYEKYDKTKDYCVLCPFCNKENYLTENKCECGAPIIK